VVDVAVQRRCRRQTPGHVNLPKRNPPNFRKRNTSPGALGVPVDCRNQSRDSNSVSAKCVANPF
jgi:hypothetical protein